LAVLICEYDFCRGKGACFFEALMVLYNHEDKSGKMTGKSSEFI